MTFLESHQVARFVIGDAVSPAAVKDSDPFEGQSTQSRLVASAMGSARLVESLCPVHPGLVAAAFGHGRETGILLERGDVWEALAPFTEGEPVTREHRRLHREEHEEVVLEQGRNDRTLGELQADSNERTAETLAEFAGQAWMARGLC